MRDNFQTLEHKIIPVILANVRRNSNCVESMIQHLKELPSVYHPLLYDLLHVEMMSKDVLKNSQNMSVTALVDHLNNVSYKVDRLRSQLQAFIIVAEEPPPPPYETIDVKDESHEVSCPIL